MVYGALGIGTLLLMAGMVATMPPPSSDVEKLPVIAELPDPFLRSDGTRVQTKRDWQAQRKTLLSASLRYEYGPLPPVPRNVAGKEIASRRLGAANATEREILLTMGPRQAVQTHLILTIPAGE